MRGPFEDYPPPVALLLLYRPFFLLPFLLDWLYLADVVSSREFGYFLKTTEQGALYL